MRLRRNGEKRAVAGGGEEKTEDAVDVREKRWGRE
jgi:hypothetical protein